MGNEENVQGGTSEGKKRAGDVRCECPAARNGGLRYFRKAVNKKKTKKVVQMNEDLAAEKLTEQEEMPEGAEDCTGRHGECDDDEEDKDEAKPKVTEKKLKSKKHKSAKKQTKKNHH